VRDIDQAMRGLVASAEPAVVLSSLARSCNPAFSDSCTVELSEGVDDLFRVTFPMPGAGPPAVTGKAVSTSFRAAAALGHPSFAGMVVHSWAERDPTEDDAIIARLLVDRAVALVHAERLAATAARADERAAKLAIELITSRVEGEAIGILATKHQAAREEALWLLRQASHASHRKLYEVATDVVRTGDLERPPHRGASSSARRDGGEQRARPVAVASLAGMKAVGRELPGPGRHEVGGYLGDRQAARLRGLVNGPVDPDHVGDAGPAEDSPDPGG
jgi:hypothetical protein